MGQLFVRLAGSGCSRLWLLVQACQREQILLPHFRLAMIPVSIQPQRQRRAPVIYAQATVQYAGFWLRVVAYLIDSVVIGVAFMALFIPFAIMTGLTAVLGNIHPGEDPRDVGAVLGGTFFLGLFTVMSLAFLGGWLYHAKMESSSWQATLGKKALNCA